MKKFHFPLRTLAVLRAYRQEKAREIFAAAVQAYVVTEDELARVRAERNELETVMHDGRRATYRAADEISFWAAYRSVCENEVKAGQALTESRLIMEKRRQEYLEAHRAVKVVEKLEQKARATHQQAAAREAQGELDELAGARAWRSGAASTAVAS